ncbi:FG-nucleoporin NUP159 [Sugiyamaella lignohabitans]|uniref:FG-nucleoporin NUP159 n=1 Tax=Sugiyamaella lignohabitans TaxID=796027 RepID=A0A167DH06_9ASCO|nr:FG-nucleoporin NUP159 [Sugiyamaella lignohabitans]ANB12909.1 FG-nucleoporin NUP159 [Sugiyamaella lignohabitans]
MSESKTLATAGELEVNTTEDWAFLHIGKSNGAPLVEPYSSLPKGNIRLLALAQERDVFACAGSNGLSTGTISELRKYAAIEDEATSSFESRKFVEAYNEEVQILEFTSDEKELLVAKSNGGVDVFTFSKKATGLKKKPKITIQTDNIIDIRARPLVGNEAIILEASGDLSLIRTDAGERSLISSHVSSAAWSPLGTQILVGLNSGHIRKITIGTSIKQAEIPVPADSRLSDGTYIPVSITYIRSKSFIVMYREVPEPLADGESEEEDAMQTFIGYIVTHDPESHTYNWDELEDPCPPFADMSREGWWYTQVLTDWTEEYPDIIAMANGPSSDVALLTSKEVFNMLEDRDRASLPFTEDDTTPIGFVLDYSSKNKVLDPCNGVEECSALPIVWALSNEGALTGWHIVWSGIKSGKKLALKALQQKHNTRVANSNKGRSSGSLPVFHKKEKKEKKEKHKESIEQTNEAAVRIPDTMSIGKTQEETQTAEVPGESKSSISLSDEIKTTNDTAKSFVLPKEAEKETTGISKSVKSEPSHLATSSGEKEPIISDVSQGVKTDSERVDGVVADTKESATTVDDLTDKSAEVDLESSSSAKDEVVITTPSIESSPADELITENESQAVDKKDDSSDLQGNVGEVEGTADESQQNEKHTDEQTKEEKLEVITPHQQNSPTKHNEVLDKSTASPNFFPFGSPSHSITGSLGIGSRGTFPTFGNLKAGFGFGQSDEPSSSIAPTADEEVENDGTNSTGVQTLPPTPLDSEFPTQSDSEQHADIPQSSNSSEKATNEVDKLETVTENPTIEGDHESKDKPSESAKDAIKENSNVSNEITAESEEKFESVSDASKEESVVDLGEQNKVTELPIEQSSENVKEKLVSNLEEKSTDATEESVPNVDADKTANSSVPKSTEEPVGTSNEEKGGDSLDDNHDSEGSTPIPETPAVAQLAETELTDKASHLSIQESTDKPAGEPTELPVSESTEEPSEESAELANEDSADKSVEEPNGDLSELVDEKPVDKSTEVPSQDANEEHLDTSDKPNEVTLNDKKEKLSQTEELPTKSVGDRSVDDATKEPQTHPTELSKSITNTASKVDNPFSQSSPFATLSQKSSFGSFNTTAEKPSVTEERPSLFGSNSKASPAPSFTSAFGSSNSTFGSSATFGSSSNSTFGASPSSVFGSNANNSGFNSKAVFGGFGSAAKSGFSTLGQKQTSIFDQPESDSVATTEETSLFNAPAGQSSGFSGINNQGFSLSSNFKADPSVADSTPSTNATLPSFNLESSFGQTLPSSSSIFGGSTSGTGAFPGVASSPFGGLSQSSGFASTIDTAKSKMGSGSAFDTLKKPADNDVQADHSSSDYVIPDDGREGTESPVLVSSDDIPDNNGDESKVSGSDNEEFSDESSFEEFDDFENEDLDEDEEEEEASQVLESDESDEEDVSEQESEEAEPSVPEYEPLIDGLEDLDLSTIVQTAPSLRDYVPFEVNTDLPEDVSTELYHFLCGDKTNHWIGF